MKPQGFSAREGSEIFKTQVQPILPIYILNPTGSLLSDSVIFPGKHHKPVESDQSASFKTQHKESEPYMGLPTQPTTLQSAVKLWLPFSLLIFFPLLFYTRSGLCSPPSPPTNLSSLLSLIFSFFSSCHWVTCHHSVEKVLGLRPSSPLAHCT